MSRTTATRAETTARTRENILDAATELFAERGYRAVSLRDVASAAGLSHPGLLRHFDSKADLLREVVDGLNLAVIAEFTAGPSIPRIDDLARVAQRNAEIPRYVELFSGLLGVLGSPQSSGHELMAQRYRGARPQFAAIAEGCGMPGDPAAEGARLIAAWDGLQVVSLYLPEVDVPDALRRRSQALAGRGPSAPFPEPPRQLPVAEADEAVGYAAGRRRREQILEAATTAFAQSGYHGASVREIASMVGVSSSALAHHFPSKEDLLIAVLARRDEVTAAAVRAVEGQPALDRLRGIVQGVTARAASEAGLIELYVTLSTEATAADHPAHEYFAERYCEVIGETGSLFAHAQREGALPDHLDPWFEALWWVALWDGLQVQWLYEPAAIDIAGLLLGHLDTLRHDRG